MTEKYFALFAFFAVKIDVGIKKRSPHRSVGMAHAARPGTGHAYQTMRQCSKDTFFN